MLAHEPPLATKNTWRVPVERQRAASSRIWAAPSPMKWVRSASRWGELKSSEPSASPEHLAELATAGVPLVLLDRVVVGVAADSVLARNAAGARAAVAHLAGLGHRRIGVVSDSPEITSSAERIQGYRQALRA